MEHIDDIKNEEFSQAHMRGRIIFFSNSITGERYKEAEKKEKIITL